MPLSEREQKLLEQLEQQLYADDPRFASQMRTKTTRVNRLRVTLGAVGVLAGLTLVLTGVSTQLIWLGVIGFVVMVVGGFFVATPRRWSGRRTLRSVDAEGTAGPARPSGRRTARRGSAPPRQGSFMDRLAARWEQRRRDGEL